MTKILDRVRKLLALAMSDNVHEAAAAAAQAQNLITRHRIDRASLTEDNEASVRLHDDPLDEGSRVAQWRLELAMVVAEANGCRVVVLKDGRYSEIKLVGHEDDIGPVRALYAWLVGEVQRLARSSKRRGRDSLDTFRMGAILTIEHRLKAANVQATHGARREATAQGHGRPGSTALVRTGLQSLARRGTEAERVADEICEGREESLGEFGTFDADAFVDGAALGHTVDLSGHQNRLPQGN